MDFCIGLLYGCGVPVGGDAEMCCLVERPLNGPSERRTAPKGLSLSEHRLAFDSTVACVRVYVRPFHLKHLSKELRNTNTKDKLNRHTISTVCHFCFSLPLCAKWTLERVRACVCVCVHCARIKFIVAR